MFIFIKYFHCIIFQYLFFNIFIIMFLFVLLLYFYLNNKLFDMENFHVKIISNYLFMFYF